MVLNTYDFSPFSVKTVAAMPSAFLIQQNVCTSSASKLKVDSIFSYFRKIKTYLLLELYLLDFIHRREVFDSYFPLQSTFDEQSSSKRNSAKLLDKQCLLSF